MVRSCLIIPTYQRPEYLHQTLTTLQYCLRSNTMVLLSDDASGDEKIIKMIYDFKEKNKGNIYCDYIEHSQNLGIALNLKYAINHAIKSYKNDVIITLDSDFIVNSDFFKTLFVLYNLFGNENNLITGFNSDLHPIKKNLGGFCTKDSIGGGNLIFNANLYYKHIEENLTGNDWDWKVCSSIKKANGKIYCSLPSICQHIGKESTIQHPFSFASDFN